MHRAWTRLGLQAKDRAKSSWRQGRPGRDTAGRLLLVCEEPWVAGAEGQVPLKVLGPVGKKGAPLAKGDSERMEGEGKGGRGRGGN